MGVWLDQAGFPINSQVDVIVDNQLLIIKPAESYTLFSAIILLAESRISDITGQDTDLVSVTNRSVTYPSTFRDFFFSARATVNSRLKNFAFRILLIREASDRKQTRFTQTLSAVHSSGVSYPALVTEG